MSTQGREGACAKALGKQMQGKDREQENRVQGEVLSNRNRQGLQAPARLAVSIPRISGSPGGF